MELINDKNDLLTEAKKNHTPESWDNAQDARNLVSTMNKDAKRDFLTNEIENDHEPSKFWKKLHSMFPDKPSHGKINLKDQATDNMISEDAIANYANSFFTSVGSNFIHETGFKIEDWFYEGIEGIEFPQNFNLREFEVENVLSEIKNLKISKPSGLENISTKIIKDALWALAHQFTWLLNMSVRMAKIPREWKKAQISLVPKDGDLTDINNFRPIAILPVVSKIMEHLIQSQTMSYLEENNILDVHQGGFRQNNSTTATTSAMLDNIFNNINNGQLTYSIFIDFRKAFDSINHDVLLKKLVKLGFNFNTIKWFQNYLTNRTQYTVVNNLKPP